jgi:hypothetical protein
MKKKSNVGVEEEKPASPAKCFDTVAAQWSKRAERTRSSNQKKTCPGILIVKLLRANSAVIQSRALVAIIGCQNVGQTAEYIQAPDLTVRDRFSCNICYTVQ